MTQVQLARLTIAAALALAIVLMLGIMVARIIAEVRPIIGNSWVTALGDAEPMPNDVKGGSK